MKRVVAIVILSITAATAAVFSGVLIARNKELMHERDQHKQHLEMMYQESLYQLNSNVGNVETNLAKLALSADQANQITILSDLARNCDNASESLARLPLANQDTYATQKYIAQAGDFSASLRKKIAGGGSISPEEEETILRMGEIFQDLSSKIADLTMDVGTDFYLSDQAPQNNIGYFGGSMKQISEDSLAYPELIYDGPFSDAIENKHADQDMHKTISEEEAKVRLANVLSSDARITYQGRTDSDAHTYNFFVHVDGREYFVQTCVCSGKIVLISGGSNSFGAEQKTAAECQKIAEDFAKKIGYEQSLKAVWSAKEEGYYFIQLAPVIDDTVYYTDTIKVKISYADGNVVGLETFAYQCNASNRKSFAASLSQAEAVAKLKKGVEVTSVRKAVIPRHGGEVLTYEFVCNFQGNQYFVYINAQTGREESILRVMGNAVI